MEEFFQAYAVRTRLSGSRPFFEANTLWPGNVRLRSLTICVVWADVSLAWTSSRVQYMPCSSPIIAGERQSVVPCMT
jgi:hypothetical protein